MGNTNYKFRLALALCLALPTINAHAQIPDKTPQSSGIGFSKSSDAGGAGTRYTLHADSVPVMDLLKVVLSGFGSDQIQGSVNGKISLHLRDVTEAELWKAIETSAVPPIKVILGKTNSVIRDPAYVAAQLQQRINAMQAGKYSSIPLVDTSAFPIDNRQFRGLEKPITMVIPDDAPISLLSALAQFEKQSGVQFALDPRVSGDIKFIASVTRMPLNLLLDRIAPSNGLGALKWFVENGRVVIAPSDRIEVRSGINVLGSTIICLNCHAPLGKEWSYCSHCGQITPRGQMIQKKLPVIPRE